MTHKLQISFLLFALVFSLGAKSKNNASTITKQFKAPENLKQKDYVANTIYFKVFEDFRNACNENAIADNELQNAFNKLGIQRLRKLFPNTEKPKSEFNSLGQKFADLTLTYEFVYTTNTNIVEAINILLATNKLAYAEPKYIHNLHFTPNDPSMQANQNAWLTKINAYNAWNTSTGDTNVVIGIVDSGTDIDHPDLVANLKINYNEPINGIDDDNDGYIDNYRGWDVSENDNNPNIDNSDHGSHVSGCAAAATNNGVGVAAPGFNCKFLPVKCASQASTTSIDNGYEGIVYAADHGCNIINCSWGGSFSGETGQDAVTYATINRNCLVLASAGNSSADEANYPASYQYVTSVAATSNTDIKASFSTYNYTVDVSAPGQNIYSTLFNNSYGALSGTSMSSPIAAGAAGLIKSVFPTYTGLQVGEQLRVTCSNIYNISSNQSFINKLGKGRINMGNSLTQIMPSVRMEPINITDGNDDAFVANDTLIISGNFINYLAATANCDVILSAQSNAPYVTILNSTFNIGSLATLSSISNNSAPFKVKINSNAPANTKVLFKLTYTDVTTYSDVQVFELIVNVDYINVNINNIATTITSKGRLFYNADNPSQGLGFAYNDTAMAYECGLMIGTSTTKLVNNVRGATAGASDNDFKSLVPVKRNTTNPVSDFDLYGVFTDGLAATATKIGLEVAHKSFAWNQPGHLKYVIVEYTIKNKTITAFSNLFAGIFTDWDIQNYATNLSDQDLALKLGYAYSTNSTKLYAGVKVLTNQPFNMYAVDNVAGGNGGLDFTDGITTDEKYNALSTSRPQAGGITGQDVINTVSTGPYSIAAGDSIRVAFALIGGDDLLDLKTSAVNAQIKYDSLYYVAPEENSGISELYNNQSTISISPNPSNGNVRFTLNIKELNNYSLSIYDASGKLVRIITNSKYNLGVVNIESNISDFTSGIYNCVLKSDTEIVSKKLSIMH